MYKMFSRKIAYAIHSYDLPQKQTVRNTSAISQKEMQIKEFKGKKESKDIINIKVFYAIRRKKLTYEQIDDLKMLSLKVPLLIISIKTMESRKKILH